MEFDLPTLIGKFNIREDYGQYITQAGLAAENANIEEMLNVLDKIPLIEMDPEAVVQLGVSLVGILVSGEGSGDQIIYGCQYLNSYFDERNTLQTMALYVRVLQSKMDDTRVASFLSALDLSYYEIFQECVTSTLGSLTSFHVLQRLDRLMAADTATYLKLISIYSSIRYSEPEIYQLLANRISQLVIIDPPKYLLEPKIPLVHEQAVKELMDIRYQQYYLDLEEIAERVTELGVDDNILFVGETDTETKNFINQYKFLTLDVIGRQQLCDIIELEYPIFLRDSDLEEFRKFGPCNPVYNPVEDEYDRVNQRMLTCFYNDNVNEAGSEIYPPEDLSYSRLKDLNWFEGTCDRCSRGISYLHHAVRRPVLLGGWTGCFCSWNCVINSTDNTMSQILARTFAKQLRVYKLYDRSYHQPSPMNVNRLFEIMSEVLIEDEGEIVPLNIDSDLRDYIIDQFQSGLRTASDRESISQQVSEEVTLNTNLEDELSEAAGYPTDITKEDNYSPEDMATMAKAAGVTERASRYMSNPGTWKINRPVISTNVNNPEDNGRKSAFEEDYDCEGEYYSDDDHFSDFSGSDYD